MKLAFTTMIVGAALIAAAAAAQTLEGATGSTVAPIAVR